MYRSSLIRVYTFCKYFFLQHVQHYDTFGNGFIFFFSLFIVGAWSRKVCINRSCLPAWRHPENNNQFNSYYSRMYRGDILWSTHHDSPYDLKMGWRFYFYCEYTIFQCLVTGFWLLYADKFAYLKQNRQAWINTSLLFRVLAGNQVFQTRYLLPDKKKGFQKSRIPLYTTVSFLVNIGIYVHFLCQLGQSETYKMLSEDSQDSCWHVQSDQS